MSEGQSSTEQTVEHLLQRTNGNHAAAYDLGVTYCCQAMQGERLLTPELAAAVVWLLEYKERGIT